MARLTLKTCIFLSVLISNIYIAFVIITLRKLYKINITLIYDFFFFSKTKI